MNLHTFLLVLISLGAGSVPADPERSLLHAVAATIGLLTGWALLAWSVSRQISSSVQQETVEPLTGAECLERQLAAMRWLGLGVVAMALYGFGLAPALNSLEFASHCTALQAVILTLPAVVLIASLALAEHEYGVRLGYVDGRWGSRWEAIFHSLKNGPGWILFPIIVLMGISDLSALLFGDQTRGIAMFASLGVFVVIAFPLIFRLLFKTQSMPTAQHDWAKQLLAEAGVKRIRVRRWDTGGTSQNALVAGFVPPWRTVLVSDRLWDEMPTSSLAMILLHEAAHLRRRHMPIRILSILPAWLAGFVVTTGLGQWPWASACGIAAGVFVTILAIHVVAHRTEFDADDWACRTAAKVSGQLRGVPRDEAAAAEALSFALQRITMLTPSASKNTWLHPSVARRINAMRKRYSTFSKSSKSSSPSSMSSSSPPSLESPNSALISSSISIS